MNLYLLALVLPTGTHMDTQGDGGSTLGSSILDGEVREISGPP